MQVNDEDCAWLSASDAMRAHGQSVRCSATPVVASDTIDAGSATLDAQPAPPAPCPAPSIVSALYWVHKDAYSAPPKPASAERTTARQKWWFSDTVWATELAPRPVTNALNPIPAKPLKLAYAHPTDAEWVGVPRFWGMSTLGAPREDRRSEGSAISAEAAVLARPLREIQQQALAAILKSARACGGAFVQADCGACLARTCITSEALY